MRRSPFYRSSPGSLRGSGLPSSPLWKLRIRGCRGPSDARRRGRARANPLVGRWQQHTSERESPREGAADHLREVVGSPAHSRRRSRAEAKCLPSSGSEPTPLSNSGELVNARGLRASVQVRAAQVRAPVAEVLALLMSLLCCLRGGKSSSLWYIGACASSTFPGAARVSTSSSRCPLPVRKSPIAGYLGTRSRLRVSQHYSG